MKELENAANMKKGNRLSHAGRRGYRALQEITTLKGTEGYQGLSVLVVGPTNPEQLHLSPDGLTIVNADSMIRDQFKAFLRGIDFRKGVESLRGRQLRPATLREGVAEARGNPRGVITAPAAPNRLVSARARAGSRSRRSCFGSSSPPRELDIRSESRGTGNRRGGPPASVLRRTPCRRGSTAAGARSPVGTTTCPIGSRGSPSHTGFERRR